MDLITNLPKNQGFSAIFVVVDVMTGYVCLKPLKSKSGKTIRNVLEDICCTFGIPEIIQSDNGREFKNKEVQELCENYLIDQRFSLPYSPETNGKVERMNRCIGAALKKLVGGNDMKGWVAEIPHIQMALNCLPREHGQCPFQLVFLRLPKILNKVSVATSLMDWIAKNDQVVKDMWKSMSEVMSEARLSRYSSLKRKAEDYLHIGQVVYAYERGSKLDKWMPKRKGPFIIAEKTKYGHYILEGSEKPYKSHELRPC